jgi:hemerythrin-like domain-containing protein
MPITIGAKAAGDFSNPIELLSDCHRRIERFLRVLVTVAQQAQGGPMTRQQQQEWVRALDYFRNAAPRHTADEEESLFPRLRQIDLPQIREALVNMQQLEGDHLQAAEWHDRVEELGRRWLAEGRLTPQETASISDALTCLSKLYERHIALEDQSVFPLAASVLPHSEKAGMGVEMAQRRGLDPHRIMETSGKLHDIVK